jgi:hypothetical protein
MRNKLLNIFTQYAHTRLTREFNNLNECTCVLIINLLLALAQEIGTGGIFFRWSIIVSILYCQTSVSERRRKKEKEKKISCYARTRENTIKRHTQMPLPFSPKSETKEKCAVVSIYSGVSNLTYHEQLQQQHQQK